MFDRRLILTLGVMMCFLQGILLLTMILKFPDLTSIGNIIQYFWPGVLAIACLLFYRFTGK